MTRIHHTNNSSLEIPYIYRELKLDFKPAGLWYDINNSWTDWCKENTKWKHENHFELEVDLSKILLLDSVEKTKAFHAEYSEFASYYTHLPKDYKEDEWDWITKHINWKRVSEKYSGIEINPYWRWEFDATWYSSIDVSSGCLWDLSCIKSFKQINLTEKEKIK